MKKIKNVAPGYATYLKSENQWYYQGAAACDGLEGIRVREAYAEVIHHQPSATAIQDVFRLVNG